MATIYKRRNKQGTQSYYFNISINGNRIRKFAGYSKDAAQLKLKKLEYDLIFKVGQSTPPKSFEDALDSFKEYIQTTGITDRQVKTVCTKIGWFKDAIGINNLEDISFIQLHFYVIIK